MDDFNDAKVIFTDIADRGLWSFTAGEEHSIDGDYSLGDYCHKLTDPEKGLVSFLKKHKLTSIFDASCGGHHWSRRIDWKGNDIKYIGGEIVESKVFKLNKEFPEKDFRVFDIISDKFPEVDVWLCKDTMIHFPLRYIHQTLRNFLTNSNIPYCLLTTNNVGFLEQCNIDIHEFGPRGGGNCVQTEWCIPPFNFPPPLDVIDYTNLDPSIVRDISTHDARYTVRDNVPRFFLYLFHRDQLKDLPFIVNEFGT